MLPSILCSTVLRPSAFNPHFDCEQEEKILDEVRNYGERLIAALAVQPDLRKSAQAVLCGSECHLLYTLMCALKLVNTLYIPPTDAETAAQDWLLTPVG